MKRDEPFGFCEIIYYTKYMSVVIDQTIIGILYSDHYKSTQINVT